MNHLIVGLGNIGHEYDGTRHNIGFSVVDYLAEEAGATWEDKRYGFVTTIRVKNQTLILLKPSTYMNLSGNAVRYWMNEKKIPIEQTLVVVDDLALPFGHLRLKASGSEAGHNGLKHITQTLGTQQYARLRFGIGNGFPKGGQVDFVLGQFGPEDRQQMPEALKRAAEAVKSYALQGIDRTMNLYNQQPRSGTPPMNSEARIDKWLWAARIYKTRTLASDACKNGRITINGALAKPSRTVKVGDQVGVKKSPITYSFRVLQTIEKRVGAKLLPEVFENVTPPEQYELLEMNRISGFVDRARGTGRPTKKDRRALDDFAETPIFLDEDFDLD